MDRQNGNGHIIALPESQNADRSIVAVIPAYNEERFIGSVVLQTRSQVPVVIVVDDGSTDATAAIAEAAGAQVISHAQNGGKAAAMNTGFCLARTYRPAVVVVLDGDFQHLPEEIATVTAPILDGRADLVVGSRYLERKSDVPRHRVLGHLAFNALINGTSGVELTDSQSGFRAFSPRALDAITFHSNGFSVESEMQYLANELGLKMTEVPITIQYTDKPKRPVISHGMMVLNGVLRLVGQYRPLLFFGVSGALILLVGLALGTSVIHTYEARQALAIGNALITVLLVIVGTLTFFTGITLHSIRGLLMTQAEYWASRRGPDSA